VNKYFANMKQIIKRFIFSAQSSGEDSPLYDIYMHMWLFFLGSRIKRKGISYIDVPDMRMMSASSMDVNGEGNKIIVRGRLHHVAIKIVGSGNVVFVEEGCQIDWTEITIISNDSRIDIGRNTTINGKPSQQCLLLARGEQSHLVIGCDCMLSYGVEIRTSDSHPIFNAAGQRINYSQDILIKDHVWVAGKVLITKGVTIEDGAIVGAGSVVTNDVEGKTIVGGVPARKIKSDIVWRRQ